jgi:hypothetical protein
VDCDASLLAQALTRNRSLTSLNLACNDLFSASAASLAQALMKNTGLRILDLENNNVGAAGAASLARALQGNSTLIKLHLGSNKLGPRGAVPLAEALHINDTLEFLNVWGNELGQEDADGFAKALETNHRLLDLKLRPSMQRTLQPYLDRNCELVRHWRDFMWVLCHGNDKAWRRTVDVLTGPILRSAVFNFFLPPKRSENHA